MKYQIPLDKISPDGFKQIVRSGKLFAQLKLSPFTGAAIQGTEILNSGDKIDCFEFEVTESGLYKCYTSTSLNGTYTERKSFGGSEGKPIQVIINNVPTSVYEELSYAEWRDLRDNSRLSPGGSYAIQDFETVYDQPDYQANGQPKASVETKTGAVHPLIVTAISPSHISPVAFQPDFPKDRILYDWTFDETEVMGQPAKGRIIERIDEWGNRTDYDHRVVLFKRYESEADSGIFNQYKDNGESAEEFLTFPLPGVHADGNSIDNIIGNFNNEYNGVPFLLANNVFGLLCVDNLAKSNLHNNTFGENVFSNDFGDNIRGSIFGSGFNQNYFYEGVSNSIFPDNTRLNMFEAIVTDLDLSSATLIKGAYSKQIIRNSAGVLKLTYIDGDGNLVVTDITA